MIVDLGEGGLVRPWASVSIDGTAQANPAPERPWTNLGKNSRWISQSDDYRTGDIATTITTGCRIAIRLQEYVCS